MHAYVIAKIYIYTLHDRSVVLLVVQSFVVFFLSYAIYSLLHACDYVSIYPSLLALYVCLVSTSANIEAYLSMLISSFFKDHKLFFSEGTTCPMFVTPFLWSPRTLAKWRFLVINCQSSSSCKHKPLECIFAVLNVIRSMHLSANATICSSPVVQYTQETAYIKRDLYQFDQYLL